jgi:hypothetical protein
MELVLNVLILVLYVWMINHVYLVVILEFPEIIPISVIVKSDLLKLDQTPQLLIVFIPDVIHHVLYVDQNHINVKLVLQVITEVVVNVYNAHGQKLIVQASLLPQLVIQPII